MRTLIAGCGYVGIALGERLIAEGHEVWGLRRNPAGLPPSFRAVAADMTEASGLEALAIGFDHVVYSASAGESTELAYRQAYVTGLRNVLSAIGALGRVFFTSSTAVYAQRDGSWVDETSETAPTHFTGSITLEAEQLLSQSGLCHTILRCAGIYGPGRHRLIESVRQNTATPTERFTNRIHRDDLVGAIAHLIRTEADVELLVVTDDDPAPQTDVARYLARALGVPEPSGKVGLTESLRGGHKRCRNDRLKATGYRLQYPTYREGYADILAKM